MIAPLAVVVTVDQANELRMFSMTAEQSELIMKVQLSLDGPDDRVKCLHFFIKAKSIIVSTEFG